MRYCVRFYELARFFFSLLLLVSVSGISLAAEPTEQVSYAKTITALQKRYMDEVTAHQKYSAYAQRAEKENYPNIAHLFRGLAASEAVHARNFKKLLLDLSVKVKPPEKLEFTISTTKDNIRHATTVEAEEIDKEYPQILESIAAENHKQAVLFITYAWKAEEQHRKLILKIKKASKRYFGFLAGRIEDEPNRYYVCMVCGSTLTELPAEHCPICNHSASEYQEVPGFPGIPDEE
jgi:rubrerythrin